MRTITRTLFAPALGLAFALSLPVSIRAQAPASASPDPVEGKWLGTTGFPEDRIEIGFEIRRNEKGELAGFLYEPVLNLFGTALPGPITREDGRYVAKEMGLSLALDGDRLDGTFMSLEAPIELRRVATLPADPPVPDLPSREPRWRTKLCGPIYAPAAVRGGFAYVGSTGGVFHAVALADGKIAWTFSAGRPMFGEALATDAHVYFVCDIGFLFKLERATGKEVWRYDLGDAQVPRVLAHTAVYDYDYKAPKPVLVDGMLYVGSGDGALHAVEDATGARAWRTATQGKIRASAAVDGERVLFGGLDGFVYALDRATGDVLWKKNTFGPVTCPAAVLDGRLVIGNRGAVLYALKPDTGDVLWRTLFWGSWVESEAVERDGRIYVGSSDLRRVSALDPADGRVIWRTDVFGCPWGRPLVTDKLVYVGAAGAQPYEMRHFGSFVALERASGKIAWRWAMPAWPGSYLNGFAASPALEGETLVIGGLDGTLYGFTAG